MLILFLWISRILAASFCEQNMFCVYGNREGPDHTLITVHAAANGWAALGFGETMTEATMVIGWSNSTGGYTLSDRIATDYVLPEPIESTSMLVPLVIPAPSWANISFTIRRPLVTENTVITKDTSLIYAYAFTAPKEIDNPAWNFQIHAGTGYIGPLDLTEEPVFTSTALPTSTVVSTVTSAPVITSTTLVQTTTSRPAPTPTNPTTPTTPIGNHTASICIVDTFCVYSEPDGNGNVYLTFHSSAQGWTGFGVGASMTNAGMILGWKNGDGGYTVSDRTSRALSLPVPIETVSKSVPLRVPAPSWSNMAFTVFRPFSTAEININSGSEFIYALGQRAPRNLQDPRSTFSIHNVRGSLGKLDLTIPQKPSVIVPPPTPESPPVVVPVTSSSSTCIPNTFCVYSEQSNNGEMILTVHSAASGWASLGIGASMENAIMIVGWRNSGGSITLSDRRSTDRTMPRPSTAISKLVDLKVPAPSWANLAFSFSRPMRASDVEITSQTVYIYAYSSAGPSQPDNPNSNFAIHTGRGSLGRLDISKVQPSERPLEKIGEKAVQDAKSVCVPSQFCFYGELDGKGSIYITVHAVSEGWASLGIGASMDDALMIVGWRNSTGGITVSDRYSTSRILPPVTTTSSVVVPLRVPQPPWAKLAFTVFRPLSAQNSDIRPETTYIYGFAARPPTQLDNPASVFGIHDSRGSLGRVDLTTPPSGATVPSDGTIDQVPGSGISSTCVPNKFCVYAEPEQGTVTITVHSAGSGWASIGTGVNMRGSAMTVGWRNSTGGITISDRLSNSDSLPPVSEQVSFIVPLAKEAPSWAKLAYSYKRPLVTKDIAYTPTTEYIYAFANREPAVVDDRSSAFVIHTDRGQLGPLDFTRKSGSGVTEGGSSGSLVPLPDWLTYSQVIAFHGYVMIVAWVIAPILGIFVARYYKSHDSWFKIHIMFMVFGVGILSLVAIIPVFLFKTGPHFSTLPNIHPLLGLILTILMVVQFVLGYLSDKYFDINRTAIPVIDKLHWWVGRLSTLGAQVNIVLGILIASVFDAYSIYLPITFAIALIGGILLMAYGENKIGQKRINN